MTISKKDNWILCPVCGNKTRLQIRADTELKNFPLYCPKCRQESLIDAKDLQVILIENYNIKYHVKFRYKFFKYNHHRIYIRIFYEVIHNAISAKKDPK